MAGSVISDYKGIPGLLFSPDFISEKQEKFILLKINEEKWDTTLARRTQQYGYRYDYNSLSRNLSTDFAPEIPKYCNIVINKLLSEKLIETPPDQLIVNEYTPGQGISKHTDSNVFEDRISSLSLNSGCIMSFESKTGVKTDVYLPRRSLVVLTGKSRYEYTHEIAKRKSDRINGDRVQRDTRVSLTFRTVSKPKMRLLRNRYGNPV
jgi:alkylated DNA repair dioxygenase AlkB